MGFLIAYVLGVLTTMRSKNNDRNNVDAEANKERKPFPIPLPVLNMPVAPSDEERSRQEKNDSRKKWKFRVEIIGLIVLTVYAGFTIAIWHVSKKSADAAKSAADTAAKQLEMAERPWVSVEMKIVTPFVFDSIGAGVGLQATLKNTGHSPAARVWAEAEMLPTMPADVLAERDRYCNETKAHSAANARIGDTIFPEEHTSQPWAMYIKRADAKRVYDQTGFISPVIIACVVYRSTFNDSVFMTSKIRTVFWTTPEGRGPESTFKFVDNSSIPMERLGLLANTIGANYAE